MPEPWQHLCKSTTLLITSLVLCPLWTPGKTRSATVALECEIDPIMSYFILLTTGLLGSHAAPLASIPLYVFYSSIMPSFAFEEDSGQCIEENKNFFHCQTENFMFIEENHAPWMEDSVPTVKRGVKNGVNFLKLPQFPVPLKGY